jgi:hypothetical protein
MVLRQIVLPRCSCTDRLSKLSVFLACWLLAARTYRSTKSGLLTVGYS